jgi:tellurite methyltransferase
LRVTQSHGRFVADSPPSPGQVASWLLDHQHLLPQRGDALDLACGRGRHALWLGSRGLATDAIDRDASAVAFVDAEARRRGLPVRGIVADLEAGDDVLQPDAYDLIVVVHYLHRPLLPAVRDALRPGGILAYETFTTAQAERGKPTNPAFLLKPGELRELVAPLEVLVEREGEFEGKMLASVIARRP